MGGHFYNKINIITLEYIVQNIIKRKNIYNMSQ